MTYARNHFATAALDAYCHERGMDCSPDENITDLITDLLHLLDNYEGQASAALVLEMVQRHYQEEHLA